MMTVRNFAKDTCESCGLRINDGCPVMDSCHMDVIRLDGEGFPSIAYSNDCDSCFLCELDCPNGAVTVSAEVSLPFLERYPK
jgi:NAD-dependent dihydropyrimidine dehydrogenase PreA subunit